MSILYPCPVCENEVFEEIHGYEICPHCWWEDDGVPEGGGPNRFNLLESRHLWFNHGITNMGTKCEPGGRKRT